MPNRTQSPQAPQPGGRNPMQTSPDDDEAQVGDQTHLDGQDPPRRARRRHDKDDGQEPEGSIEEQAKGAGP